MILLWACLQKRILKCILKLSLKTCTNETFLRICSSCICIRWEVLLGCSHEIYVLYRPSLGWGDCGGNCTLFGSMWAVYTLGSSCWSGRKSPLDKLQKTSPSLLEPIMHRKRIRSCPNSHPPALYHHFYLCAFSQFTGLGFKKKEQDCSDWLTDHLSSCVRNTPRTHISWLKFQDAFQCLELFTYRKKLCVCFPL